MCTDLSPNECVLSRRYSLRGQAFLVRGALAPLQLPVTTRRHGIRLVPVTGMALPWSPNDVTKYEVCTAAKIPFLDMLLITE
jgi:hypothetical protein